MGIVGDVAGCRRKRKGARQTGGAGNVQLVIGARCIAFGLKIQCTASCLGKIAGDCEGASEVSTATIGANSAGVDERA